MLRKGLRGVPRQRYHVSTRILVAFDETSLPQNRRIFFFLFLGHGLLYWILHFQLAQDKVLGEA